MAASDCAMLWIVMTILIAASCGVTRADGRLNVNASTLVRQKLYVGSMTVSNAPICALSQPVMTLAVAIVAQCSAACTSHDRCDDFAVSTNDDGLLCQLYEDSVLRHGVQTKCAGYRSHSQVIQVYIRQSQ